MSLAHPSFDSLGWRWLKAKVWGLEHAFERAKAAGKAEDDTPYDFSLAAQLAPQSDANATPLAYDIVYNPLETRFLREARAAGRRCISGLEMFFGQGDAQFCLWTGQGLPAESRRALEKALGPQPR